VSRYGLKDYLSLAGERETMVRGLRLALVVGSILILINYGDRLIVGEWPPVTKLVLTYCVPFLVSVWTSVSKDLAREECKIDQSGGIRGE